MKEKQIFIISFLLFLISISCENSLKPNNFPPPPEKPAKFIVEYKGKKYRFESEIERRKFMDSIGVIVDTSKHIE